MHSRPSVVQSVLDQLKSDRLIDTLIGCLERVNQTSDQQIGKTVDYVNYDNNGNHVICEDRSSMTTLLG